MGGVRLGLEVCIDDPPLRLREARRFGLLCNQASVDGSFRYAHELLAGRFPGRLAALFGPQHGLWSEQQDNMVETPHGRAAGLGVPIHSLYADRREPTAAMLDGLDLLLVDLQDVGTRVYTYVWTLLLTMRACGRADVPVLVLDRPNPLGGEIVEGPRLQPGFESFVGLAPIPMRHALTIGELARWARDREQLDVDLDVLPVAGWTRNLVWSDLGRAWVPTSPNLPRFEAALVYPGQVLLEGTNLSEGRGTTTPFECCGAAWLEPRALTATIAKLGGGAVDGLALRPFRFQPTFHKFADRSCGGVFLHPLDPHSSRSYRTTLAILAACRRLAPRDFAWRAPPYEYEERLQPIDILSGSSSLRHAVDAGASSGDLDALAAIDAAAWRESTAACRLYGV